MPVQNPRNHHQDQMQTQRLVLNPVLLSFLTEEDSLCCLDLGCGVGAVSECIARARPGLSVIGGDLPGMDLETARSNLGDLAKFIELDLSSAFPFSSIGRIDIAVSVSTFMYLDDQEFVQAGRELMKVLPRGQKFILIDPHPDWQAKKLKSGIPSDGRTVKVEDSWKNQHIKIWWRSVEAYQANLEKAGFQVHCHDIVIPSGLDLAPRYQQREGEKLYLVAEATVS